MISVGFRLSIKCHDRNWVIVKKSKLYQQRNNMKKCPQKRAFLIAFRFDVLCRTFVRRRIRQSGILTLSLQSDQRVDNFFFDTLKDVATSDIFLLWAITNSAVPLYGDEFAIAQSARFFYSLPVWRLCLHTEVKLSLHLLFLIILSIRPWQFCT